MPEFNVRIVDRLAKSDSLYDTVSERGVCVSWAPDGNQWGQAVQGDSDRMVISAPVSQEIADQMISREVDKTNELRRWRLFRLDMDKLLAGDTSKIGYKTSVSAVDFEAAIVSVSPSG